MAENRGYPLESFFAPQDEPGRLDPNPAMLDRLRDAEVIIGIDVMTRNEFLLFGKKTLEEIVRTGKTTSPLFIEIDQGEESDELEKAVVMIETVKGRCDYQAG